MRLGAGVMWVGASGYEYFECKGSHRLLLLSCVGRDWVQLLLLLLCSSRPGIRHFGVVVSDALCGRASRQAC
jgi:hypothetical protein